MHLGPEAQEYNCTGHKINFVTGILWIKAKYTLRTWHKEWRVKGTSQIIDPDIIVPKVWKGNTKLKKSDTHVK